MNPVREQRAAASAQISRSLKAWRSAKGPEPAGDDKAAEGADGAEAASPEGAEGAAKDGAEAQGADETKASDGEAKAGEDTKADAGEGEAEEAPTVAAKLSSSVGRKIYRDDKDKKDAGPAPTQPPKPQLDEGRAMKILNDAFSGQKQIVKGAVQILEQAGFQQAYDGIYGTGPYKWDTYVKPRFGNLNGFAYNGTNYINKDIAGTHTVVHEVLHNNAAGDFAGTMGSSINEGVTDLLTVEACTAAGEPAPVCYPGEQGLVQAMAGGVGLDAIKNAYFHGAGTLVTAINANCKAQWPAIKALIDAGDHAAATAKLAKK